MCHLQDWHPAALWLSCCAVLGALVSEWHKSHHFKLPPPTPHVTRELGSGAGLSQAGVYNTLASRLSTALDEFSMHLGVPWPLGPDVPPSLALAVTFRPDGAELAVATLNSQITFWDPENAVQVGSIEGRHDLKTGRKELDKITAKHSAKGK